MANDAKTLTKRLKDELDEAESVQEQNRNLREAEAKQAATIKAQAEKIKTLEARVEALRKSPGVTEADVDMLFRMFAVVSFDRNMRGEQTIELKGRRSHTGKGQKFDTFAQMLEFVRAKATEAALPRPRNPFSQPVTAPAAPTKPDMTPPPPEAPKDPFVKKTKPEKPAKLPEPEAPAEPEPAKPVVEHAPVKSVTQPPKGPTPATSFVKKPKPDKQAKNVFDDNEG